MAKVACKMIKIPCEECLILARCKHKLYSELIRCTPLNRFIYYGNEQCDRRRLVYAHRVTLIWNFLKPTKWGVTNAKNGELHTL